MNDKFKNLQQDNQQPTGEDARNKAYIMSLLKDELEPKAAAGPTKKVTLAGILKKAKNS